MYGKIDMWSFADFYHRFSMVGLTIDEIFENWEKYRKDRRDINDTVRVPEKLKKELRRVKPPALQLMSVRKKAALLRGVSVKDVNSKARDRPFVEVRQWVAFVGIEMGFEPPDFETILGWERSGIYHKRKKADELSLTNKEYREKMNQLLKMFGLDVIIA